MNNKFFPANFTFIIIITTGTIISLSSSHWLIIWIGLELNLIGILPLINIKFKNLEIEASVKYFIIQSIRSSLFIIASIYNYIISISIYSIFNTSLFSSIITISLLIKLGRAPFHLWLPSICKNIRWLILFLILTWQKLAPLFILSFLNINYLIIILSAIFRSIIGRIQAINQSNIQLIIVYSSISHLGWILPITYINNSIIFIYLLIYSIIILPIFITFSIKSILFTYSLTQINNNINKENAYIVSLILSLGGIPPILGFLSKLITLNALLKTNIILLSILLFIGTLTRLYFYLNLIIIIIIKSFYIIKIYKIKFNIKSIICFNLLGTFIFLPIIYAMNILNKS